MNDFILSLLAGTAIYMAYIIVERQYFGMHTTESITDEVEKLEII